MSWPPSLEVEEVIPLPVDPRHRVPSSKKWTPMDTKARTSQ